MALVEVFRSTRKADTYLYVPRGTDHESLPSALMAVFGKPEYVLGLDLQPERALARYSGQEVLDAIAEQGFFLQMPEGDEEQEDASC